MGLVAQRILFGSDDIQLCQDILKLQAMVVEVALNPMELVTAGLLSKYGLNPAANRFKKFRSNIKKRILALFRKMYKL